MPPPHATTILTSQPADPPLDPNATRVVKTQETGQPPIQMVGAYTIQRRLGSGAMGDVHLAKEADSGQLVALKFITDVGKFDAGFIQRFDRECALLSRLDHPNIAKALRYGTDQGRPYLAMEYVPGMTLVEVIGGGALDQSRALLLTVQIARGLEYAYEQIGLIHRDVKPGNIIVSTDDAGQEIAKIIDFGLAKDMAANTQNLTMVGMMLGTPHYMSPEQIRNQDHLTFATDLYALGATLFQLITGQLPYIHTSPAEVISAHLTAPVPNPQSIRSDIHPRLSTMVQRCLAKAPEDRYPSYRAFITDCTGMLETLGVSLEPTRRIARQHWSAVPMTPAAGYVPARTSSDDREEESSSRYRPVSVNDPGRDPLVPIAGQSSPDSVNTASEALRVATSKRYARLRVTHRIRRKPALLERLLNAQQTPIEPAEHRSIAELMWAALPWLLFVAATVAVLVWMALKSWW